MSVAGGSRRSSSDQGGRPDNSQHSVVSDDLEQVSENLVVGDSGDGSFAVEAEDEEHAGNGSIPTSALDIVAESEEEDPLRTSSGRGPEGSGRRSSDDLEEEEQEQIRDAGCQKDLDALEESHIAGLSVAEAPIIPADQSLCGSQSKIGDEEHEEEEVSSLASKEGGEEPPPEPLEESASSSNLHDEEAESGIAAGDLLFDRGEAAAGDQDVTGTLLQVCVLYSYAILFPRQTSSKYKNIRIRRPWSGALASDWKRMGEKEAKEAPTPRKSALKWGELPPRLPL